MPRRIDHRLSLSCIRELRPGAAGLSDEQVLELRDRMYDLANVVIAAYKAAPNTAPSLAEVPESDRPDIEERAAIFEFEANLTRMQAERLALSTYLQSKSCH